MGPTSCAKAVTSPDTTVLVVNQFMAKNLLMRTLLRSILSLVCCRWLIVDLILMVLSFLLLLWSAHGWMENIVFSERLLRVWMLSESARLRVVSLVLPGLLLRLLLLVNCKFFLVN